MHTKTLRHLFAFALFGALAACGDKGKSSSSGSTTAASAPAAPAASPALTSPDPAKLDAAAPDSFVVRFSTSRGDFDVKVHRDWAPHGADRLYYLVNNGYYDGTRFFRVLDNFMAQFGINGNPAVSSGWRERRIPDDPSKHGNLRGVLTFATAGPNTRTTQLFINFKDNRSLDSQGFSGVGQVVNGMSVVDSLYKGYGEGAPEGQGPEQGRLQSEGNTYLAASFPKLDTIATTKVTQEWRGRGK